MILIIDTCSAEGGVALVQMQNGRADVVGEVAIVGRTFAAELIPAVSVLLQEAGVRLQELDAVAVLYGPGSFTGVRIGVSAAKGLVEAASIPLIAISRLEVLVRLAGVSGRTLAVLDGGRGGFYAGVYAGIDEGAKCLREALMSQEEVVAAATELPTTVIVCEASAEAALAVLAPTMVATPKPRDAAAIAAERWQAGRFEDVAALDGNYLRRIDAEIFLQSGRDEAGAGSGKAGNGEYAGS